MNSLVLLHNCCNRQVKAMHLIVGFILLKNSAMRTEIYNYWQLGTLSQGSHCSVCPMEESISICRTSIPLFLLILASEWLTDPLSFAGVLCHIYGVLRSLTIPMPLRPWTSQRFQTNHQAHTQNLVLFGSLDNWVFYCCVQTMFLLV